MKRNTLLILVGLLAFTTGAYGNMTDRFPEEGRVTNFDKDLRLLVIEDGSYYLTAATKIYSSSGQLLSAGNLREGTRVRYRIVMPPNGKKPIIPEILVMPSN